MNKWKKHGRRVLVFLLVMGFITGMMDDSPINAAAAEAVSEEETSPKLAENGDGQLMDGQSEPNTTDDMPEAAEPNTTDAQSEPAEPNTTDDMPEAAEPNTTDAQSEPAGPNTTDDLPDPAVMPAATDAQIEAAWNAMTEAMKNWAAEVDLSGYNLSEADLNRILPDVIRNNPDLFYVFNYEYFTSAGGGIEKCTFSYNPQYTANSVAEYEAAIDRALAQVIENGMTDEQKATALHDYLVQHMVYDKTANSNPGFEKRNAYEALVNGIGVCEGYALAYAALLKEVGIEVDYCRSQNMNHIWNYVKLGGNWYHADLTYDDITADQVGATGYVKHTYFLLSDDAMRNAAHNWEPNGITCNDTSYDTSWHKTAPLAESAIYAVGGHSYYLKSKLAAGSQNVIGGAALMKRDSSGNETEVKSFILENGWPMFSMSFSRLSCFKGVLYFNVGNSVYAFQPATDAEPAVIYQYTDADKRIVTGLVSDRNGIMLEIYNPQTSKIEDHITIPVFSSQEEQKNFAFSEKAMTVTYGDNAFTMTAQGAEAGSVVRYSSSDPSVASIDPTTGRVTIQKAGSAVITAIASETANYLEAKTTCALTVSPKTLTWDVSALQAGDRLDLITGKTATLYGELKLTGILEKDKGTVRFTCKADKLTGVYETVAAGRQKVKLSWKNAQDTAVLQGDGCENYAMPAALPEIQGNIRLKDESTFKTEVENGISKVPESFQNKEHLNTPEKIEKEIKAKLQEKYKGIQSANIAVYDVELLINENGFGWKKATKENFPSKGLTVTLPYPPGTGKTTHNFVVTHMFTEDMNGFRAGDVEHPAVTKTNSGITFKVYGLSPIAVGWEKADSSSSGGGNHTSDSSNTKVKAPRTGDTFLAMPYVWMLLAASAALAGLFLKSNRSRRL